MFFSTAGCVLAIVIIQKHPETKEKRKNMKKQQIYLKYDGYFPTYANYESQMS